jgi:outer membrane receptor for ferrienterochelin and colicins
MNVFCGRKFAKIWLFVLLAFTSLLGAYELKGVVKDAASGGPLESCYIIVYNLQGTVLYGETTDIDGAYSIFGINEGNYMVEANHVAYGVVTIQVKISNRPYVLDFELSEALGSTDIIVVSAGRRAEKLSDASANIQVVEAKPISIQQEGTAFGTIRNVTGINYTQAGLSQQQINARGYTSVFTTNMLTLVDYRVTVLPGISGTIPSLLAIPKEDIKQIEVISGPNSALYGANAGFGVVNIISKDPKEFQSTDATIAFGNQNMLRTAVRSSGLLGEMFGYKFAAERYMAKDFPSYVTKFTSELTTADDPQRDDADFDIDNYAMNGSLYFYPNNTTTISYNGGYALTNAINQSNIGRLQLKDFEYWYHQGRININEFFGLGSLFLQGYFTSDRAGETINLIDNSLIVDKPQRLDLEMQHNYTINKENYITWGASWRQIQPNSEGTFLSDGPDGEKIELEEWSAYLQYENEMLPYTRLTMTGRYDDSGDFGSAFTPKFAINFNYLTHSIRASYSEAFGSIPIQPAFALTEVAPSVFLRGAHKGFTVVQYDAMFQEISRRKVDPIELGKVKGFELGYRGVIAEKLFLDVTAHTTQYSNFVSAPVFVNNAAGNEFVLDDDGNPRFEQTLSHINFGEVDIRGIDFHSEYWATSNLSFKLSFSYIEAGDFNDIPAGVISASGPLTAPDLNAPNRTWKGGIRYSNWLYQGSFAELTGRYVDDYFFNGPFPHNRGVVPTFFVLDLDAEIPLEFFYLVDTRFGINLRNILNNEHVEMPGTAELSFLGSAYVAVRF